MWNPSAYFIVILHSERLFLSCYIEDSAAGKRSASEMSFARNNQLKETHGYY